MTIIGVDPGLDGAITFWGDGSFRVYGMPIIQGKKKGRSAKGSRKIDRARIGQIFRDNGDLTGARAFVERVGVMPGQGNVSGFTFGTGYGLVLGALAVAGCEIADPTPQTWKTALGLDDDKEGSLALADLLLPTHKWLWAVTPGRITKAQAIGRAESALIAYYGRSLVNQGG